jgi:REP element-mobilizing transposase RayT
MRYPIAYFIPFTTYGTWLHGDKRGSVDKKHNLYRSEFVGQDLPRSRKERSALKNSLFLLTQRRRKVVLNAIFRVCENRGWVAHAVHVRANHVHIVVTGSAKPEKMMTDFKAYGTRAIKNCMESKSLKERYWTQHGSTKYLWTKQALVSAISYVKNEQGRMMEFGSSDSCGAPNVSEGSKL